MGIPKDVTEDIVRILGEEREERQDVELEELESKLSQAYDAALSEDSIEVRQYEQERIERLLDRYESVADLEKYPE